MSLTEVLLIVKKRFWLIIAGALVAGSVALVLSLLWPPSYEARSMLLITKLRPSITLDPRYETVAEENVVNLSIQDDQVRRQTLVALTESRDLALQVLDILGDTLSPEERSVAFLRNATSVETMGNLLAFGAQANTPEKAADIANAWAEVYQDHVNRLYSTTSPTYEQVQSQLSNSQADYEAAKITFEAFVQQSDEEELTRQVEQKSRVLNDLQEVYLVAAKQRVAAFLSRSDRIDRLLLNAQSLHMQLGDASQADPLTDGEQFALFALEVQAFAKDGALPVSLEFTEGWAVDGDLTAEQAIDHLEDLIVTLEAAKTATRAEVDEFSSELLEGGDLLATASESAGKERIAQLQVEINELWAELESLTVLRQDLLDARTVAQESYFTLVRKAAEVQILSQLTGIEVQTAADAQPPENPAFPQPLIATFLGAVAGGLVGLALIFVLEMWPREEHAAE